MRQQIHRQRLRVFRKTDERTKLARFTAALFSWGDGQAEEGQQRRLEGGDGGREGPPGGSRPGRAQEEKQDLVGGRGGGGAQLPQEAGQGGEPLLDDGRGDQRERGLVLQRDEEGRGQNSWSNTLRQTRSD